MNPEEIKTATTYLLEVYDRLTITRTRDLAEQALNIAQTTKTATYDALFIALTQKQNGILYTADKQLVTTAEKMINTKLLKPN